MDFDSLGGAWVNQPSRAGVPEDEMVAAVGARAAELDRVVRLRDRIETWGALLAMPIFASVAVVGRFGVSRIGAAILALACLLIPIWFRRARRPPPDPTLPIAQMLSQELDRVRAQQRLLGTVLWWYLAPLGIGVVLFLAGPLDSPWLVGLVALGVAAFFGGLFRLNRRAIREDLEPRARELENWIAGLRQD